MKDDIGEPIELDLGDGERVRIRGTHLAEPEKALVIERALELAAVAGRSGAPETIDFERAARELSATVKTMDAGEVSANEQSVQVLNQEPFNEKKKRRSDDT